MKGHPYINPFNENVLLCCLLAFLNTQNASLCVHVNITCNRHMFEPQPFCLLSENGIVLELGELQLAKTAALGSLHTKGLKEATIMKVTLFCV